MSLSSVGSASDSLIQLLQQRRQAAMQMMQAVKSGDLTQSQAALTQLGTDRAALGGRSTLPSAGGDGGVLGALSSLLSSVSAGSASGAPASASTLQSDLASLLGKGSSSASSATPAPSSASTGGLMSDLQAIISSAQSGNLNGATSAAGKLTNDISQSLSAILGPHHHHGQPPATDANDNSVAAPLSTPPANPTSTSLSAAA